MALKKKPVTGMKDILPREMEVRDYVISLIKKTYDEIETSVYVLPIHSNAFNIGIDRQTFPDYRNRPPFTDKVEMVIRFKESSLRLPLLLLFFSHIRNLVNVFHKDVAAADSFIHACPVVCIYT